MDAVECLIYGAHYGAHEGSAPRLRSIAAPYPVVMNAYAVASVVVPVPMVMAMVMAVVVVVSVGGRNSTDAGCCCDKGKNGFLHCVANCSLGDADVTRSAMSRLGRFTQRVDQIINT
jgi:hypothetical protein